MKSILCCISNGENLFPFVFSLSWHWLLSFRSSFTRHGLIMKQTRKSVQQKGARNKHFLRTSLIRLVSFFITMNLFSNLFFDGDSAKSIPIYYLYNLLAMYFAKFHLFSRIRKYQCTCRRLRILQYSFSQSKKLCILYMSS